MTIWRTALAAVLPLAVALSTHIDGVHPALGPALISVSMLIGLYFLPGAPDAPSELPIDRQPAEQRHPPHEHQQQQQQQHQQQHQQRHKASASAAASNEQVGSGMAAAATAASSSADLLSAACVETANPAIAAAAHDKNDDGEGTLSGTQAAHKDQEYGETASAVTVSVVEHEHESDSEEQSPRGRQQPNPNDGDTAQIDHDANKELSDDSEDSYPISPLAAKSFSALTVADDKHQSGSRRSAASDDDQDSPRPPRQSRASFSSFEGTDTVRDRRGSSMGHMRSPMSRRRNEFLEKLMGNSVSGQAMMKNAVLSALPVSARSVLLEKAEELQLSVGAVLMAEGDPSDCMFFITDGSVAIIKSGVEIARQENGGVLGEMGILTGQPRTATVKCVTDVRVLRISAAHFLRVTDCHPVMYRALLREMVDKVQCTQQVRIKQSHVIQDALDILTKTVSDEVLSLLVDDTSPIELLKGRTDSAAILFFDIRGFSSAAEKMQPQDLLQALNDHLQLITQQVQSSCGAIVNFIGDAVLAVFNTPVRIDFPADAALECYKNCRYELAASRESRLKAGKVCFEMGGGLNFGLVVAGAIGSENRFTYSVLGDEVNLAARLESLTRHYPVDMILSEALYEQLSDSFKAECLLLDYVQVKGRVKPVYIYTLIIQKSNLQRSTSTREKNINHLARRISHDSTTPRSASSSPTPPAAALLSPRAQRRASQVDRLETASRLAVLTEEPGSRSSTPSRDSDHGPGFPPVSRNSRGALSDSASPHAGRQGSAERPVGPIRRRSMSLPNVDVTDSALDLTEQEDSRSMCDLSLFKEAQEYYFKGDFVRAEDLFIQAGGRLGFFFVERCRECAESPHPWPGYYTWDVK